MFTGDPNQYSISEAGLCSVGAAVIYPLKKLFDEIFNVVFLSIFDRLLSDTKRFKVHFSAFIQYLTKAEHFYFNLKNTFF